MRAVSGARAVPSLLGYGIDLTWQNPPASAFVAPVMLAGIRIVRRERTFPLNVEEGVTVYPAGASEPDAYGPVASRFSDRGLTPLKTFYYTVFAADSEGNFYAADDSRAAALVAEDYPIEGDNLVERLYKLLPAIHQRYDKLTSVDLAKLSPDTLSTLDALPPHLRTRGPLRRFLHAAAAPLNVMRSSAEGLRQLHDVDLTPPQFLLPLAQWVGWELDRTLPVYAQRSEIKFAPRLFRSAGTVPNLRAIINRYTGWYSQITEFAQHVALSNTPSQLNIFAMVERAGIWRGTDAAAPVLGFATGNNNASGGGASPATLTSSNVGPFELRPGMELTVTADRRIPTVVRFERGNFADITKATAEEVSLVLNRTLSEVTSDAVGGRVMLRSNTVGLSSSLHVDQQAASLVTLESAPRGRLSAFVAGPPASSDKLRLFYETADPTAPAIERAALKALGGTSFKEAMAAEERTLTTVSGMSSQERWLPAEPLGRVRYKTFRSAQWGESFPLSVSHGAAQSDPAAVEWLAPDGSRKVFLAWVHMPIDAAHLTGFGPGNDQAEGVGNLPATLISTGTQPFRLRNDAELAVTVDAAPPVIVRLTTADFADIEAATAMEVANVLKRVVPGLVAAPRLDGRIELQSVTSGAGSRLKVENAARLRFALGTPRVPQYARLRGQRSGPFQIRPGTYLILRGNFSEAQVVEFRETDFDDPGSATSAEVVAALNARLTRAVASVQTNNAILLQSLNVGGEERLEIDLRNSSAAAALGFDALNASAVGDWGDEIDWLQSQDITAAGIGRHADLSAVVDDRGHVRLFWANHRDALWRIFTARWDGTQWSHLEMLSAEGLGNREPCAVLDADRRVWLIWSQRQTGARETDDTWSLRRMIYTPSSDFWSGETALTTPRSGRSTADREPGVVRLANGDLRVFFHSNRNGGPDLWSLNYNPATSVLSDQRVVASGAQADYNPAPLLLPGGALWLLLRSDRSISLSRAATRPLPLPENRLTSPAEMTPVSLRPASTESVRLPDSGTLRRSAGSTSVVLDDVVRLSRRRTWDELLSYTPQEVELRPGSSEGTGASVDDVPFYTRSTVGIFLSQTVPDSPLSQQLIKRLLPVLERFLPINVRVVVILAPRVDIDFVYGDGAQIGEAYLDQYPFIEYYEGPGETVEATHNVILLRTNTRGDVSGDPSDRRTLRKRTYSPPPE